MNCKGITVRKINKLEGGTIVHPSKKELKKQITTLHKKLQKNDSNVTTEYSIEQDTHKAKYHSHLLVRYTDESNLFNQLERFIGGSGWDNRIEGFSKVTYCDGKYGEVDVIRIYDEVGYRNYMNKSTPTRTLV